MQTGRPARIDELADDVGPDLADAVARGVRSGVGAPGRVDGHLWGFVVVAARAPEALPQDTEERLTGFTELVGTAIANAEVQAQLTASRARIVAAGDATRRRSERDLHDGAQQRLVSLALQLRSAASAVPPGADDLATQLAGVRAGLSSALEELREITRGLHPTTLAEGGLTSALKGLARRSAIPVRLHVGLERRLPETVELAVLYAVAEVLTNTAKHAGASVVDLTLTADENRLCVEIHDDGAGGARVAPARGWSA